MTHCVLKFSTHATIQRKQYVIPNICGPRLPDINNLQNTELKELYGQITLILFKPFRNLQALLGHFVNVKQSWWRAFKSYKLNDKSKRIISNLNDYHTCKMRASSKHLDLKIDSLQHITANNELNIFSDNYENILNSFETHQNNNADNNILYLSTGKLNNMNYYIFS